MYEYDQTIKQHFQIQNYFPFSTLVLLFGNYSIISLLIVSSVSLPSLIFSLLLHTKIVRISSLSFEETKFMCIFV